MPREKRPGRGSDQFPLRLPDGMRDRIKGAAEHRGISMNEIIIEALEERFPPEPTVDAIAAYAQELIVLAKTNPANRAVLEDLGTTLQHLISTVFLDRVQAPPEATSEAAQAVKGIFPEASAQQIDMVVERLGRVLDRGSAAPASLLPDLSKVGETIKRIQNSPRQPFNPKVVGHERPEETSSEDRVSSPAKPANDKKGRAR